MSTTKRGPKRHLITVTRRDIRACEGSIEQCSIAHALRRRWPHSAPRVYYDYIRFGPVIVDLPRSARRFIERGERIIPVCGAKGSAEARARQRTRHLKSFSFYIQFRDLLP